MGGSIQILNTLLYSFLSVLLVNSCNVVYQYPYCLPDCVAATSNQVPYRIYNISDTCYQAIDDCDNCLGNGEYPGQLEIIPCDACPTVSHFGFVSSAVPNTESDQPFELTLITTNSYIYHCTVYPTAKSTEYSCNGDSSLIPQKCIGNTLKPNKNQMIIEQSTGDDAAYIEEVFFVDDTNTRISVNQFCFSNATELGSSWNPVKSAAFGECNSYQIQYDAICIDNQTVGEGGSCYPSRIVVDIEENTDTGNVYIAESVTCDRFSYYYMEGGGVSSINSFGLTVSSDGVSPYSGGDVTLTLYVAGSVTYQCVIHPVLEGTTYSCDANDLVPHLQCTGDIIKPEEIQLIIDNSGSTDGLKFDSIFINVEDNVTTIIEDFCADVSWGDDYVRWWSTVLDYSLSGIGSAGSCDMDELWTTQVCVDKQQGTTMGYCYPARKIISFHGGRMENAANVSCDTPYPTKSPTEPTIDPTFVPTSDPTADPTVNPTVDPTIDPTVDPTIVPTVDPTTAPSSAPSAAPSTAPTTCYEQDSIFSNDGAEHNIHDLLDLKFINIVEDTSKIINVVEKGLYFSKAVMLTDDHKQELRCKADNSCLYSNILVENNSICNILCNGAYSCATANINIKDAKNTQIICNGTHSCSDMTIYIDSYMNSNITIECGVAESCVDLQIDIVGNNNNAQISCIDINSCDGLNAATDAANYENVKLNMFSYSNNVTFINGFGYQELNSSTQYVECNTKNKWVQWNTSWNSPNHEVILSEYINNQFPCNDLKIECFENNYTEVVSSCSLQYDIIPFNVTSQNTTLQADCYWVELKDIVSVSCDGDCVTSPTYDPTTSPTASPTEPTTNPTSHPTVEPTTNPTLYPTIVPTINPTSDPTNDPTSDPTMDPTIDPTNNPTYSPSAAPSHVPTTPPTNAPSTPPTNAPSESPSQAPSSPPTRNPTNNPTYSPSQAPSRVPTGDIDTAYDTYIITQYAVSELSVANKEFIVSNTVKSVGKMEEIIESNYFADEILEYTEFFVNILTINEKNADIDYKDISTNAAADSDNALTLYDLDINNFEHTPMTLICRIECAFSSSEFIIAKTQTPSFEEGNQNGFREYFENNNISFVVKEQKLKAEAKNVEQEPEDSTALVLSTIIISIGLFSSILAFIYNNLSFTKVDNAVFLMPFLISLNLYDFLSDVNLAAVIIATAAMSKYASYTSLMFWLAVLSVLFILLPFSSNLFYAMRIRRQRAIKNNPSARVYFGTHLAQFILLCVFCAGTYPVLGLTSSRLFGLDIFNAGLLSSELHQLSKIKIRSTIFLENLPQLMIQILYYISTVNDENAGTMATILAFVASLLSVVASVIIYQAQKDVSDEFIVEKYFIQLYNSSGINKSDRETIKFCKGLKSKMGELLCQVFNISNKSIEIGFVTVNDHGLIVHLQHQIYKEELDTLKKKLLSGQNFMPTTGYVIDITPDMYIERLFDLHRNKILNALVEHFRMVDRKKEFDVSYHKHMEDANDYEDENVGNDSEGDDLLIAFKEKMTSQDVSRRNVLNNNMPTSIRSVNISEQEEELQDEQKGEMMEMTEIPTSINDRNNDQFSKAFQRIDKQMKQMKQQQMELKQMLGQFLIQHDIDSKMSTGAKQTIANDNMQIKLKEAMSEQD